MAKGLGAGRLDLDRAVEPGQGIAQLAEPHQCLRKRDSGCTAAGIERERLLERDKRGDRPADFDQRLAERRMRAAMQGIERDRTVQ
jgi:hypothetical protein